MPMLLPHPAQERLSLWSMPRPEDATAVPGLKTFGPEWAAHPTLSSKVFIAPLAPGPGEAAIVPGGGETSVIPNPKRIALK